MFCVILTFIQARVKVLPWPQGRKGWFISCILKESLASPPKVWETFPSSDLEALMVWGWGWTWGEDVPALEKLSAGLP